MKRFKTLLSNIFIMAIISAFIVSCSAKVGQRAEENMNIRMQEENKRESASSKEAFTIVDRAGNEIIIPEEINSIISLAPSITEILIDLGFGDKLVLVDAQTKALVDLPKDIESVDLMTPDTEQMIVLKPDIVFASSITSIGGTDPTAQLTAADITIAFIPTSNSIEEIYEDIMFIAQVLQVEDKGEALVNQTKERIAKIEEISKTIEEKDKKTVFFEIAALPQIYSFGSNVYLNEMIELIGAKNILASKEGWMSVSEEAIVAADPDVILTNVNYIEEPVEEIKSRTGWENVKAIKNNNVYYIDNKTSSLPNHNIVQALEEMAKAVYPDKY
ncbi:ABC transporter substrate-binding protein [Acetivibrio saccincola]|uniref:ABC transporter substrate-binding protein n=1 Tax=Acetivibrio saccincola TaxID=1677857 RepID=UPI0016A1422D|nr:ABC transporter substrate-binding protein [Acetivibrio saccincola]NLW27025.1 ABC transporter substrate-binding protein [Acetivibrio saccincola]